MEDDSNGAWRVALWPGQQRRTIREITVRIINSGLAGRSPISVNRAAKAKEAKNVVEIFRRAFRYHRILYKSDGAEQTVPRYLGNQSGKDQQLSATKPDDYQRTRARGVYQHSRHDRQGQ